ncbi:MAG: efflux RND transporter periplasmic adaptor subunit, partial [Steroidobacteraceae bacterium]
MFARNALVFSLLMTSGLASAAEFNTAKLSETQLKSAGVTTMTVPTTPTGNDGKSLARNNVMLSGRVTIPNSRQARVVATLAGQVQSILVNIGEPVRNGTPLLRIYSTELLGVQRDYLHARSASIVSEQKFKRDQSLYEDGIISLGRLEETRQAQQQDATNLQEQRQLLKLAGLSNVGIAKLVDATAISPMMTINSPLNGVALEQTITPGMRVSAGDELFLVADINTLWIEAQATAAQLDQLANGNIVHVSSCSKPGRVAAISPIIARDNQTGLVRIEITPVKQCL